MKSNLKKVPQKRRSYDTSFKEQAVALGKEFGMKEATEKLGLKNDQVLGVWTRESRKKNSESSADEYAALKEENKKLKRELEKEKKITAILKDATLFFCQDQQK
ncbi:MAG: transposase [Bacteriovorax sp.]|nr:transposase [Bacteriovorax sp.]